MLYILLALDGVGVVRLDAHDGALDEFAIVDDVICLGGEHALDVVVDVAEDYAISLAAAIWLGAQRLDLKTLQDRGRVLRGSQRGIGEDGAATAESVTHNANADARDAREMSMNVLESTSRDLACGITHFDCLFLGAQRERYSTGRRASVDQRVRVRMRTETMDVDDCPADAFEKTNLTRRFLAGVAFLCRDKMEGELTRPGQAAMGPISYFT